MSIVHKTVAVAGDSMEFVLSDATIDRYGDSIDPDGWDLRWFKRNPIALFGHSGGFPIGVWENVRVEGKKLVGRLKLAAEGTSARIDELRSLVEQGILRAVSVGFKPVETEPLDKEKPYAGVRFIKQELLETSLVSVPANPAALAVAKSLHISNETMSLAFGEQAEVRRRDVTTTGGNAAPKIADEPLRLAGLSLLPRTTKVEKTLSKRIEDAQNELNAARDALIAHVASDDTDDTQTEEMSVAIEQREQKLASLKRAEKALGSRTVEQPPTNGQVSTPAIRRPLGVQVKEPKPGDLIYRAASVALLSYVTNKDPMKVLEERYGDHEATQVFTRAAVAGATTTTAGWALELVETATDAFMESLRPMSAFPRLAAQGISLSFGPSRGAIKIPSRASTPSISGSFVAEGSPIPVRRLGLTSLTLSPHKMGVISVFTREIARYSNPQIEGLLRQEIQADTALTIDSLLIDAVAGSTTRPAGLTNGVVALTASTDGGYAAILADINALAAPFDTANAGRKLVLLMNPREARNMMMAPGPDGQFGWAAQFMAEFNPIISSTITAGVLIMVDAADFVSVNGSPEFDVSEQTVLHMEDTTPLAIGTAGTPNTVAAPAQSMFQTASLALRMLLDITWAMRRTGMVQHMASVDWQPVVP